MSNNPNAPRFQAYLKKVEGKSVFTWPRDKWDSIEYNKETLIDVTSTPMSNIAQDASVIACIAIKNSKGNE